MRPDQLIALSSAYGIQLGDRTLCPACHALRVVPISAPRIIDAPSNAPLLHTAPLLTLTPSLAVVQDRYCEDCGETLLDLVAWMPLQAVRECGRMLKADWTFRIYPSGSIVWFPAPQPSDLLDTPSQREESKP